MWRRDKRPVYAASADAGVLQCLAASHHPRLCCKALSGTHCINRQAGATAQKGLQSGALRLGQRRKEQSPESHDLQHDLTS